MDEKDIEISHLRADLAQVEGARRKQARAWKHDLDVALAALRSGRAHVAEERIVRILDQLGDILERL